MTADARDRVTALLGDEAAPASAADLIPLVYDELQGLARGFMSRERSGHTLQPTDLVHEAFLRLVDQTRVEWKGRTHFMAIAAMAMRRLLINYAERHRAQKRGGDRQRVTLGPGVEPSDEIDLEQILDLDAALRELDRLDERQARVAELRSFAGMTTDEISSALGISKSTVERDWAAAKAWLHRALAEDEERP